MASKEEVIKRRLASAENLAVRSRNYRRARERALTRLAQLHKEEYLELLEIEKKKDEQEGKRWNNLAGSRVRSNSRTTTDNSSPAGGDTATNPHTENESDNV